LIKKVNIHVPVGVIRSGRTDIQVSENGRPEEGQSAHVVDEKQTTKGRIPDGERAGIVHLKLETNVRHECRIWAQ
jgi:hypothetical protein